MSESPKAMLAPFFFLGGGSEMQINNCFALWTWPELLVEFYVLPEKQTCRQAETGKTICSLIF